MNTFKLRRAAALFITLIYILSLAPPAAAAQLQRTQQPSVTKPSIMVPGAPAQQAFPLVTNIAPPVLMQGQNYTLTVTGRDLNRISQFNFGPDIQVTALNVLNPQMAQVTVQVAPSAQAGMRYVMITAGNVTQQARPQIQIIAAPQANTPDVLSANPQALVQGQSYTLMLTVRNVGRNTTLNLGDGISITGAQYLSPTSIRLNVSVTANALPGTHNIIMIADGTSKKATAFVTVNPANVVKPEVPVKKSISAPQPSFNINSVSPDSFIQGGQYQVQLKGTGFVNGMQVNFGNGIEQHGVINVKSETEATVPITITTDAAAGERFLKGRHKSDGSFTAGPIVTVYPTAKVSGNLQMSFKKGVINLLQPAAGSVQSQYYENGNYIAAGGNSGEFAAYIGAPMIQDDIVFKWQEKNPGLADYYEFRIYTTSGKLLKTMQLNGMAITFKGHQTMLPPPTFFRPDAEFLKELLDPSTGGQSTVQAAQQKTAQKKKVSVSTAKKAKQSGKQKGSQDSSSPKYPEETSLLWEVAGYKFLKQDGTQTDPRDSALLIHSAGPGGVKAQPVKIAQSHTSGPFVVRTEDDLKRMKGLAKKEEPVAVEVEISERWPLSRPNKPNGLVCPASGLAGGPNIMNLDRVCKGNDKTNTSQCDNNNYPGDNFQISGSFTLDRSPYKEQPLVQKAPPPPPCTNPDPGKCPLNVGMDKVTNQFLNVILDWGDGTAVQPLVLDKSYQQKQKGSYGSPNSTSYKLPEDATAVHAYERPGSYTIRIYELSDEDLQGINVQTLANSSVDAGKNRGPYSKLVRHGTGDGHSKDVADRAYMIYCGKVDIREREDPDATGPLHLQAVRVTGFPGHNSDEQGSCKTGAAGNKRNPQAKNLSAHSKVSKPERSGLQRGSKSSGISAKKKMATLSGAQGADAVATTCDSSLIGEGEVDYYGQGDYKVKWMRDGIAVRTVESDQPLPPSEPRHNLCNPDKADCKWPSIKTSTEVIPNSGNLLEGPSGGGATGGKYGIKRMTGAGGSGKALGTHKVTVEADVIYKPHMKNFGKAVERAINDPALAGRVSMALMGKGDGKTMKVGFMSPYKKAVPGMPGVAYANDHLGGNKLKANNLMTALEGQHAASDPKTYKVVESDPKQACIFRFPTADNQYFTISGLQNNVTQNGTKYSGCGTLEFKLNTGPTITEEMPIPITFENWEVPDGMKVTKGTLNVSPAKNISVAGLTGTIDKISGTAGSAVNAELSLSLPDTLRKENAEKAHEWKAVSAPVTPDGDWYKDGLKLPATFIGWSSFKIQSDSVAIDLSKKKSPGAISPKCKAVSTGNEWIGVHLGTATITPYTLDLVGQGWTLPQKNDWALEDNLVCGTLTTGPFDAKLDESTFHFDKIEVAAGAGVFDADYRNMVVHMPWLDTDFKADSTKLHWQGGEGKKGITFTLMGDIPAKDYGAVRMAPKYIYFTSEQNVGWAIKTDTKFDLFAEGKQFTNFTANGLFFDVHGRASFESGTTTKNIGLSGSVKLSKTPLTLVSVDLDTGKDSDNRLKFNVNSKVDLSKVLPGADMVVNYRIKRQGSSYFATGPFNSPFNVNVSMPASQPVIAGNISPTWTGSGSGSAGMPGSYFALRSDEPVASDAPSGWVPGRLYALNAPVRGPRLDIPRDLIAGLGGGEGDQFSGSIDIGMFGGPPIKAEFRLGYKGGEDYWITRATVPLGEQGIVLVAPYVSLYALRGGLGYNFPLDAFKSSSTLNSAVPDMSGDYVFMAGMRVGSPDSGFIYTTDGDFTVKTNGSARMDFHAWLISLDHSGEGNFQGFFQYSGGNFDGMLAGKLGLLGDVVYMEIPQNAAILHFGGDYWKITAGKPEGPRIKAHLLFADTDSYFAIGSNGVFFGGAQTFNLNAGLGRITGYLETGISITPGPVIAGFAQGEMSAEICAFGLCIGPTANVGVNVSAPPPHASAHACFEFDLGLTSPEACANFSM